jgi:hypothetical protein
MENHVKHFTAWYFALAALSTIVGCGNDPSPPPTRVDASFDLSTLDVTFDDRSLMLDVKNPPSDQSPVVCATGQIRCGENCVDLTTSGTHCGRCDNACPVGQMCRAGSCANEMMCMGTQSLCGSSCVETSSDAMNCGSCGNVCPMGQTCFTGSCRIPDCPTNETRCGSTCVDPATDAANCGTCGNTCSSGQACVLGVCRSATPCAAGETSCGGLCVVTTTDLANCGGCGIACTSIQICTAGVCRLTPCPTGQTRCGGVCVDIMSSTTNCGMCGRACARGQTCAAGMCAGIPTCPTGQMPCGIVCSDLQVDAANCGMCGRACTATQACVMGVCSTARPTCTAVQTDCAPTAATPTCVNTTTDSMNCGTCGTVCPMGSTCQMGACRCATGNVLCGRACVNLQTSATHCGACGQACTTGRVCTMGTCTCATGTTLCNGNCVNTMTDANHCGACGRTCNSGQTCTAGVCACPTAQTLCGTGTTAVCVDTRSNRSNCGMCGRTCSMGQTCTAGVCACPTGQTLCGTGATAMCISTMVSPANCGRCGNVCGAGLACVAGTCMGTPPSNDTRMGATVIDLAMGASQSLMANTTNARHDTAGSCACTATGNDVFYSFTLTTTEMIFADTLGATWDTSLFLQDSLGNNLMPAGAGQSTCNDDSLHCAAGGLTSSVVARLNPGRYFLVLSGCSQGMATVHFQHLPAGNGATVAITPNDTVQTVMGSTAGTGSVTSTCCSNGPENTYFWITCPSTTATTFYASSCNAMTGANLAAYNVEIAQYSALRTGTTAVCNNDTGSVCALGATTTSTVPPTMANQAGLNTLIVDTCGAMGGAYQVQYIMSGCSAGARCGATCVDTASDRNHCGGCNRRCAMTETCVSGMCEADRPGETRSNAVAIAATSAIQVVNTALYRNDTVGTCSCTTGRDVFYTFTLTAPEIVYADTAGSTFDTSIFLQNSMGTNITSAGITQGTTCNDDGGLLGCATGVQSQILAQLPAGTYFLVLSGCGAGNANVRFQRIAVGNGATRFLNAGSSVVSGTTMGTGRVTSACCSEGPEDTFYWYTCPAFTARTFTASTCGRALWDTSLSQVSPGRASTSVCNDDACGPRQSILTSMIPTGAGLHALYIDGCTGGSGAYTIAINR